jgi:hypothetical protein
MKMLLSLAAVLLLAGAASACDPALQLNANYAGSFSYSSQSYYAPAPPLIVQQAPVFYAQPAYGYSRSYYAQPNVFFGSRFGGATVIVTGRNRLFIR